MLFFCLFYMRSVVSRLQAEAFQQIEMSAECHKQLRLLENAHLDLELRGSVAQTWEEDSTPSSARAIYVESTSRRGGSPTCGEIHTAGPGPTREPLLSTSSPPD